MTIDRVKNMKQKIPSKDLQICKSLQKFDAITKHDKIITYRTLHPTIREYTLFFFLMYT